MTTWDTNRDERTITLEHDGEKLEWWIDTQDSSNVGWAWRRYQWEEFDPTEEGLDDWYPLDSGEADWQWWTMFDTPELPPPFVVDFARDLEASVWEVGEEVAHPVYGAGEVTRLRQGRVLVRFEVDGSERDLSPGDITGPQPLAPWRQELVDAGEMRPNA